MFLSFDDCEFWINRYQTLAAAGIAVIAGWVAYQQFRTSKQDASIHKIEFLEVAVEQHKVILEILEDTYQAVEVISSVWNHMTKFFKDGKQVVGVETNISSFKDRLVVSVDRFKKAKRQNRLIPRLRKDIYLVIDLIENVNLILRSRDSLIAGAVWNKEDLSLKSRIENQCKALLSIKHQVYVRKEDYRIYVESILLEIGRLTEETIDLQVELGAYKDEIMSQDK